MWLHARARGCVVLKVVSGSVRVWHLRLVIPFFRNPS